MVHAVQEAHAAAPLISKRLPPSDNPLEAIATEHGFLPESASKDVMEKLVGNLPHLAFTASRPRQAANLGANVLA